MNAPAGQRTVYRVKGLDCAEEVAVLRKEVGRLPGVTDLDFDPLNARMGVVHDPAQSTAEDIIAAVAATGMSAVPWDERLKQAPEAFWERYGRLIMAGGSGLLLMAGLVSHWVLHGSFVDAVTSGHGIASHVFPPLSIGFYAIAAAAGAWFVLPKALIALKKLRPDMNLLMVVAVAGALGLGEWFEAATVSFLFAVANLLEHWSVGRARRAISAMMDLSPTTARYICPHDGDLLEKPVEEVPVGVTVLVRPGEKIPLDGTVTKGRTTVNQAPITGESAPVTKEPGDDVFAGAINGDGAFEFLVTKPASDTTLARIIHMVEEAQSRRAPTEQWVETFARYYTPVMMLLAALIIVVPPLAFGAAWGEWLYRGLVVLVIACPCALVISTPVSVVAGLASAARNGVLIKGGVHLEGIGKLRALALDKTGTLTFGLPEVQQIIPLNGHTVPELLERAATLEAQSEHPLAKAVLERARREGVSPAMSVENFRAVKGKGAEADVDGRPFWIGSGRFLTEKGMSTPELTEQIRVLQDAGHSVIVVGNDTHVCGLISVADGVRPEAAAAIAELKRLGVMRVVMLTGDNRGTADAVAAQTGVDEVRAELLPEDKVRAVEDLKSSVGRVAMIGDGVNDAPAMAAADTAVAMGAIGTDAAIETADIALMTDELAKVPWLVAHSRRVLRTIKVNITFALGLKFVFIVLTFLGLASLWLAIAADTGASLLVIANGLRLLRVRR